MRSLLVVILVFCFQNVSLAQSRILTCDAVDTFDRISQVRFNVDTGSVRKKDDQSSKWTDLYSDQKACGLKVNNAKNCVKKIWHNFNDSTAVDKAATFSVSCKIGATHLYDQNGELEINRYGDGTGAFICGRLSKNELYLTNCKAN